MSRNHRAICSRCHITFVKDFDDDQDLCCPCMDDMVYKKRSDPVDLKRMHYDDNIIRTNTEADKIAKANAKWLAKPPVDPDAKKKHHRRQQEKIEEARLSEKNYKHQYGIRKWNFV